MRERAKASRPREPNHLLRLLGAGLAVIVAASAYAWSVKPSTSAVEPTNYALRTENVLGSTPLIDGHNDLPYLLRLELQNKIYDNRNFTFREGTWSSW